PKSAPHDPREADRRFVAYVRDQKGRVTTSDVVALTGLSYEAAEEELTRLVVEYDGEAEVTEDGSLLYVFKDLMPTAGAADRGWRFAWDVPDEARPLTGNTSGTNAVIGGFAGFNLLGSFTIGPAFLERAHLGDNPTALFLVTLFPLLFSLIFFAVP